MQKLYCYVDESGQDVTSTFFIIVAVVTAHDQQILREQLERAEREAGTKGLKWHKSQHSRRMRYLTIVLERKIGSGSVYAAYYRKPIPYFFPHIELIEQAVKRTARGAYRIQLYVDGIDKQKAGELTNALRVRGMSLRFVKSRRDESEPLIRLADMWAGCIRSALLNHADTKALMHRAQQEGYLHDIT